MLNRSYKFALVLSVIGLFLLAWSIYDIVSMRFYIPVHIYTYTKTVFVTEDYPVDYSSALNTSLEFLYREYGVDPDSVVVKQIYRNTGVRIKLMGLFGYYRFTMYDKASGDFVAEVYVDALTNRIVYFKVRQPGPLVCDVTSMVYVSEIENVIRDYLKNLGYKLGDNIRIYPYMLYDYSKKFSLKKDSNRPILVRGSYEVYYYIEVNGHIVYLPEYKDYPNIYRGVVEFDTCTVNGVTSMFIPYTIIYLYEQGLFRKPLYTISFSEALKIAIDYVERHEGEIKGYDYLKPFDKPVWSFKYIEEHDLFESKPRLAWVIDFFCTIKTEDGTKHSHHLFIIDASSGEILYS